MKLLNTQKLKSLLLSGVLSISLFIGGCSDRQNQNTSLNSNSISENNENVTNQNLNEINIPLGSVEAIVDRVVDGDTIKLKLKTSNEGITLRLLLIDTPESVKVGVKPQPYAIEASNFTKKNLEVGSTVYIEYDRGSKTDKYGRSVGYLWYYSKEDNNWKMFNEKIVENGFARVGYIYSQKKYLNILYDAQTKAKNSKLNIWSVDGYVTDRGFDEEAYYRNSSSKDLNIVVYVSGMNSASKKYHSSQHAHNMKNAVKLNKSEAMLKGYEPCQICYK